MRMSAVSNAFNYFSDTPVAVPLVLGASNRTFNAFPFSWGAKQIVPELMTPAIKTAAKKEVKELIKEKPIVKPIVKPIAKPIVKQILKQIAKQIAKQISKQIERG